MRFIGIVAKTIGYLSSDFDQIGRIWVWDLLPYHNDSDTLVILSGIQLVESLSALLGKIPPLFSFLFVQFFVFGLDPDSVGSVDPDPGGQN
jgi:hypothetical protein